MTLRAHASQIFYIERARQAPPKHRCSAHLTSAHDGALWAHREEQARLVLVDCLASADSTHELGDAATLARQNGLRAPQHSA